MRIALDSNILLYLAGIAKTEIDQNKTQRLRLLIEELTANADILCPLQTFGEAYRVMQRFGRSREECRFALLKWRTEFQTVASGETAYWSAVDLATDHKLQIWDALIIEVSAEAGCTFLLSEDLQSGFTWRGVTIINPLAPEMDHRLTQLLSTPR